jgi:hypothetical protein
LIHLASYLEARTDYIKRMTMTVTAKNPVGVELGTTTFTVPPSAFSDGFSNGFGGG